ncbi:MAG: glycosyltransferase family 4 protein [Aureliella sp.]
MKARIALISEHASPLAAPGSVDSGGQNVYVAQVARHLAELGVSVDVFTRRDDPDLPEVQQWLPGVRVIHVPAGPAAFVPKEKMLPHMDEFAFFMRRFMSGKRRYDCVHANFFMSAYVGCRLKAWLGIPLVVTFHALGKVRLLHQATADGFPAERLEIEQQAMAQADVVIAECPEDMRDQVSLYHASPDKIRMVPCGFDATEVSPIDKREACASLGLDPSPFTVLQLGRMVPRKGVDDVIRGFAEAVRQGLFGRLLVVGSDTPGAISGSAELKRLKGIASEEGVASAVIFTGQCSRDEIRKYYGASDVFVTVPWYEPFGITPLEAMACGRPVIGAKVGGIQYTVRDGETGFHVPPRHPPSIAEKLLLLYRDAELRQRLGSQALGWVRARFTWQQVAEELAEVYAAVLADRESPVPLPASSPATAPLVVKG